MPREAKPLSDLAVRNLKPKESQRVPVAYAVGEVRGLYLQVTPDGGKSWLLRYTVPGTGGRSRGEPPQKRREIGLGGYPTVTLKQARERAREVREQISQGIDPIAARRAARSALAAQHLRAMTFEEAARRWLDKKALEWTNAKDFPRWSRQFETRLYPDLGKVQLAHIQAPHIVRVLEPMWLEVADTAKKLRAYIGNVFDFAIAKTYMDGPNPTPSKSQMDTLAGNSSKIVKKGNHPALPVAQMGVFLRHLRKMEGTGARALEFGIMTATRSGEVRGATWDEIDLDTRVWIIPAERMKAGKEHRVPLAAAVVALLRELDRSEDNNLVFPAPRGHELSDMTIAAVIKRMHESETKAGREGYMDPKQNRVCVPHGFRSTFRDWAAEHTDHPREVAEMALAHAIGNAVEAAYRRGDLFEKRRALMEDWAASCNPEK